MSFRTPWKGPVKVGNANETKTPSPPNPAPAPVCKKPIINDVEAAVGDQMWPAKGPSSPEGSKCPGVSDDTQLANSSEYLKDTQDSNSSQISKISCSKELSQSNGPSEKCKDPKAFNSPKSSDQANGSDDIKSSNDLTEQKKKNSKRPKKSGLKCSKSQSPDANSQKSVDSPDARVNKDKPQEFDGNNKKAARGSKISDSSKKSKDFRKAKHHVNSKDSGKIERSQGRKPAKRPRSSMKKKDISAESSSDGSSSSADDIPRPKVFKSSGEHEKVSKHIYSESEESETSSLKWTSSSEAESAKSSQLPSQPTSLGSQFLRQEAPLKRSPPPEGLDTRARLAWIQQRRNTGVWVYCDNPECDKQRYLADVYDPAVLPEKWYCHMNKDPERNTCEAPEVGPGIAEEEDMIVSAYTAGSLVWARLEGYPEWPAMVDDDPDYEQYYWCCGYSDIPSEYHVTFFDSAEVSRAWLSPKQIRRFTQEEAEHKFSASCMASLSRRLKVSHEQAVQALPLTPLERLRKFSFITRYEGKIIGVPKTIPPTPRRFLDEENDRKKKHGKKGEHEDHGRPSQKNDRNKEIQGSAAEKQNKKSANFSCDFSEDDENPFNVQIPVVPSDEDTPASKKSNMAKSQGPSNPIKPNFKTTEKSPVLKSSTSNLNKPLPEPNLSQSLTTTQESGQRSRKLWLELDSSSDSDDDCGASSAAQLPTSIARQTGETDSVVSMNYKQGTCDEEPASEDSTFAFAGSVCSFASGVQPSKALIVPESMESDFIENTPTDLLQITRPKQAAAVLPDKEKIVNGS